MNPRRRRHNRLTRKGTASFQLVAKDQDERRRLLAEKLQAMLTAEFQKFSGRRQLVNDEATRVAMQKALGRILTEARPEPRIKAWLDPGDPTMVHVEIAPTPFDA